MNNLIAFFEIPSVDFYRAVDFYQTVLGVTLSVFECESEKMACFTENGEALGAIFQAPDFYPSKDGVLIHFYSEDLDSTLEKVLEKGGDISIPKTKIDVDGKGYFAVFFDCEGNRVGIYSR